MNNNNIISNNPSISLILFLLQVLFLLVIGVLYQQYIKICYLLFDLFFINNIYSKYRILAFPVITILVIFMLEMARKIIIIHSMKNTKHAQIDKPITLRWAFRSIAIPSTIVLYFFSSVFQVLNAINPPSIEWSSSSDNITIAIDIISLWVVAFCLVEILVVFYFVICSERRN